ncbi:MAG: rhodanese-like domain-containing protein [Myxococcales bacterium]|nr:rhodanese-like domain-containing protein [Myxococcales bacterium]
MSHKAFEFEDTTPEALFRMLWSRALIRSDGGTPIVTPDFVAEQGQYVQLYDLREPSEMYGVVGHIPGSQHLPPQDIARLAERFSKETPIVLISNTSHRARKAAAYLETLGMRYVAALRGGMVRWKTLGFSVSRRQDSPPSQHDEGFSVLPQKPYRAGDVQTHLGNPCNVRWQKLASMLAYGKRSCVDGREDKGVIGTPGGDAGEFLLAVAAAEKITEQPLTEAQVSLLFQRYLDQFGRFYMHTDTHAFGKMIQAIRQDPFLKERIPVMESAESWTDYCNHPSQEVQEALLEQLIIPEHIGCGHLRLMAQHSEEYGVRLPLLQAFFKAFHLARWQDAPETDFVILGGHHNEEAVVNVVIEQDIHTFTKLPLISPTFGTHQMFVNHPQVGTYLREQSGYFMLANQDLTGLSKEQKEEYFQKLQEMGDQHLETTLRYLADDLPRFQACFHDDHHCTVTQVTRASEEK